MSNINTLADRYAQIKAESEAINKKLEALKAEIKELGVEEIVGDHFTVTVSLSERLTLDQKKVKEILTPAQIAACNSVALVTTIRVKASVAIAA
jgi:predicted  nucleic acid-binding Zn-ribbon protein